MPVQWRKAYDGLEEEASAEASIDFKDSTDYTVQAGRDDADINVLMRRFGVTGNLPRPRMEPFYGDFSEVTDYQTALEQLRSADQAFMALPSDVRSRFGNDPAQLWEFLHDPDFAEKNLEEARKLGLVEPEKAPAPPQRVEVVNVPPPPAGGFGGAPAPPAPSAGS